MLNRLIKGGSKKLSYINLSKNKIKLAKYNSIYIVLNYLSKF